jgi:hypothetical protein
MKHPEEANENLNKEIELKDFVINAKKVTIEKNVEQIRVLKAEHQILKSEVDNLKKSEKRPEKNSNCKICFRKFKTEEELKNHMVNEHKEEDTSDVQCLKCKENLQKTRKREFLMTRLQGMCKDFVEEKKKHKEICEFSKKCRHETACIQTCYFVDKSYVENEQDSDDEMENVENDDSDSDSDQPLANHIHQCNDCNFEGKNASGLKIHMKTDHKIKCETCGFRTTTKLLLKKHLNNSH